MKKTILIVMLITIFSKITGLVRDLILSYFYGASGISDAFLISLTIPSVIFGIIGVGISTGYIPIYSNIEKTHGESVGNTYTNNLINLLIIFSSFIIVLCFVFTETIVHIFASGFYGETFKLAVMFTRITLASIYFKATNSIYKGFLQLKKNYIVPALVGLPLNIIVIISIVLSYKINIFILPLGKVIASLSQFLLVFIYAYKKGYRHKLIIDIKDNNIRELAFLALPVIVGTSVRQLNILVDKTLASQIAVGGISALNYSSRLNEFVQGIFVMSTVTVMYPLISQKSSIGNIDGVKKILSKSISGIALLVIPATVGSMFFAEPIVNLLFGRGAFDSKAVSMTSYVFFFYSIGMIGFGIREILSRVFYSLKDTKTPTINASIAMVLNIVLNIILSKYIGIAGLALATSISGIICAVLLFISLRKKIGSFCMKNICVSFIKIICASFMMGVLSKLTYNSLINNIGASISLVISICIGVLVYFVIIYFMNIEDMDVIVKTIKRKIKKNAS